MGHDTGVIGPRFPTPKHQCYSRNITVYHALHGMSQENMNKLHSRWMTTHLDATYHTHLMLWIQTGICRFHMMFGAPEGIYSYTLFPTSTLRMILVPCA